MNKQKKSYDDPIIKLKHINLQIILLNLLKCNGTNHGFSKKYLHFGKYT